MNVVTGRRLCSRLFRLAGPAMLVAALGACSGPGALQGDETPDPGREAASRLYAGQPALVHATQFPVASAAEGVARGDQAWRQGQLDLAVYLYVQSLAFDAANPEPLLKIGAIHERRGNRALAEQAFEQALALEPDHAAASERLGLLYLQDGRDDAARAALERAISLDDSRWQSHNGLGIAADRRKDFAAAIAHYDAALAREPRAGMVANNRGFSRYLAGDFAGAEADFRFALELGTRSGTWTNLGKAQARQGRYVEALESLLSEHDDAHAHNLLGEAALESDDLDTAQNEFSLALSAAPRYFQAAQDNLDLVNKRIAEKAMGGAAIAQAAPSADPAAAPADPAVTPVTPVTPATLAMYRYGSQAWHRNANPSRKAKNNPAWVANSGSCTGAAASKPRCNPGAAKRPKSYQLASARRPRT